MPLLMTQGENVTGFLIGPLKSFFLQALLPQGKAGFFPAQHLFNNGTHTVNGFTKIYRLTMKQHATALPLDHDRGFISSANRCGSAPVGISN